jgi:hypothetical protein
MTTTFIAKIQTKVALLLTINMHSKSWQMSNTQDAQLAPAKWHLHMQAVALTANLVDVNTKPSFRLVQLANLWALHSEVTLLGLKMPTQEEVLPVHQAQTLLLGNFN